MDIPQDRPFLQQPKLSDDGHRNELAPQTDEAEPPVGAIHVFLSHEYPEGQHPPSLRVSLDA